MNRKSGRTISSVWRAVFVAAVAALLCFTVFAVKDFRAAQARRTQTEKSGNVYLGTDSIEWNGERYTLREGIEAYLILGIDMDDDRAAVSDLGGQADVLFLLVIDNLQSSYRVLQINRDTMTQVPVISGDGSIGGVTFAPVCLSHAYGSGGHDSCENTVHAVRYILSDIEIDGYAAFDMEAIGRVNDSVGGVTLTIQDDLTAANPAFTAGAIVTLDAASAEDFLRARMSLGESNNINRLGRHRQYMDAWVEAARQKTHGNSAEFADFIAGMKNWSVTDMTDKRIAAVAENAYRYKNGGFVTIDGKNESSGGYNCFYADEDSVMEALLSLFYEKRS